jgi:hypothetical protein
VKANDVSQQIKCRSYDLLVKIMMTKHVELTDSCEAVRDYTVSGDRHLNVELQKNLHQFYVNFCHFYGLRDRLECKFCAVLLNSMSGRNFSL